MFLRTLRGLHSTISPTFVALSETPVKPEMPQPDAAAEAGFAMLRSILHRRSWRSPFCTAQNLLEPDRFCAYPAIQERKL
ncbi:hypothetical protein [Aquamicrobium ahrensii]|uniref:Uncharacterized protein n=1 Tax=Aquamicrobium ahrensii TaxID=469551 RepID=A0ABV2KQH8_9HYPH